MTIDSREKSWAPHFSNCSYGPGLYWIKYVICSVRYIIVFSWKLISWKWHNVNFFCQLTDNKLKLPAQYETAVLHIIFIVFFYLLFSFSLNCSNLNFCFTTWYMWVKNAYVVSAWWFLNTKDKSLQFDAWTSHCGMLVRLYHEIAPASAMEWAASPYHQCFSIGTPIGAGIIAGLCQKNNILYIFSEDNNTVSIIFC